MSLYKQLWLALIFLMLLVFGGTFYLTRLSAKNYLEQQLFMKNSDNAAALALSLTQQDANEVLLDITLSAQFDTGHYELIRLTDPEGNVISSREDTRGSNGAPGWFINMFPIDVEPGYAQIQKRWQLLGTLELRSHSRFAYKELWDNTQQLAGIFLIAMLLAGSLGTYLLRIILRPLDNIVIQAKAIGERRFITTPVPATLEFKTVVNSMNNLSERIKNMLQQEADRLEKWRKESHVDKVTGLLNREQFMQILGSALERDDASASGVLVFIRLAGLAELNTLQGRKAVDGLLGSIGGALNQWVGEQDGWSAGRLNGSDLAILAPRSVDPTDIGKQAQKAVFEVLSDSALEHQVPLPSATAPFTHGQTMSGLLTGLDASLLASDQEGQSNLVVASAENATVIPVRQELDNWREIFRLAFKDRKFSLASYAATDLQGKSLHNEAPVRLERGGELLSAGQFLPWINRLELAEELDKYVVSLALKKIEKEQQPICINLSVAAVANASFAPWLISELAAHRGAANHIWMEVQEAMAYRYLDAFKGLCAAVKPFGSKMGIEHVGHQLSDLGRLHDVGVDYIKVDAAFVRDLDSNTTNQTLLRTLCTLGHSLGVLVIAEGVKSNAEWLVLENVGADGATGPEVSRRTNGSTG